MKDMFRKLCSNPECREGYYTRDLRKLYCCVKCKKRAIYLRRAEREAEKSGKVIQEKGITIIPHICTNFSCEEVINKNYSVGRPQKFCSDKCKKYFNYHFKNDEILEDEYLKCINPKCDEVFLQSSKKQMYCTKQCGEKHRRELNKPESTRPKIRKKYELKKPSTTSYDVLCNNCGEEFTAKRKTAAFCCVGCRKSFMDNMRRREWVHHKKTYKYALDFAIDVINNVFIECDFIDVDFDQTYLTNTKFIRCLFKGECSFNGTYFYRTEFKDCYYEIDGELEIQSSKNKFSKFDEDFLLAVGGPQKMSNMIHMKGSLAEFKKDLNKTLTNKARER